MIKTSHLASIVEHVMTKHQCHTLILYGSWARGDATATSDYDLLAIRQRGKKVVRDARLWEGALSRHLCLSRKKVEARRACRTPGGNPVPKKPHR